MGRTGGTYAARPHSLKRTQRSGSLRRSFMFKNLSRAAIVFALAAVSQTAFAQSNTNAQPAKPAATQTTTQTPQPSGTPWVHSSTATPEQPVTQPTPTLAKTPAPQTPAQPRAAGGTMLVRSEGHEYAPLLELKIDYKDWTFNRP